MLVFYFLELAIRLHTATPYTVDLLSAYEHVEAAHVAATDKVSPTLLLAIAFVESRYDVTATSRVEGGVRLTGRYASTVPPANLDYHQSLFCGPLQTFAGSWGECMAMRRLARGYAAGAAEMSQWLRDSRVRGEYAKALAGHGCGNLGVETGNCNGYQGRVLWMERWIRLGNGQ
ncbi:MAG: hypothetical protein KF773_19180 [Deltaproteobacteria bacterium]|nr:hypothetical protein [Deltaproteobacteria bacterium]MCW5804927.1 hypothetical protein [Deltaproteobacteria bacterium]